MKRLYNRFIFDIVNYVNRTPKSCNCCPVVVALWFNRTNMLFKKGIRKKPAVPSIWECDVCGKHFEITNGRATEAVRKGAKKMCSKECKTIFNKTVIHKNVTDFMKKNPTAHARLRRGCGLTNDGYVWIRTVGNGYNNQVKIHRYLMETKLGRPLRPEEIVHHIDGDKLNNSLSNLQIVTVSEHNRIHRHFGAENRNDCWSDKEVQDCLQLTADEFCRVYNRTREAYYQKRYKLHCSLKGGNLAPKKAKD